MKHFPYNAAYCRHLFAIARVSDIKTIEQIRQEVVNESEIDNIDMVNDLLSLIDQKKTILTA